MLLFAAKTSSCLNPIVFAISHPKFREAIAKEIPCLGIGKQHLNLRAFITMIYVQVVVSYDLIIGKQHLNLRAFIKMKYVQVVV